MYYADSDILTVIIAMITIAAGVYSSVAKKKSPSGNGKVSDLLGSDNVNDLSGENEKGIMEKIFVTEEEIDEEADLFDSIFGLKKEDAEEVEDAGVMQQDGLESAEEEYAEALQRIGEEEEQRMQQECEQIGQTQVGQTHGQMQSVEDQKDGLKERLKKSPKDIIVFAEILKPKFKEF